MIKLYTIGFTNKSAQQFFELLKENEVVKIVDTQINNLLQTKTKKLLLLPSGFFFVLFEQKTPVFIKLLKKMKKFLLIINKL